MGVRVTGNFAVLRGFNAEKKLQPLSKITLFCGGFRGQEPAERVVRISVLLNSINVEKKLRKQLKVAAFCGRISETVNQAAILTGLYCCNVERELQTLSNGAICGSGGFRGQEAAERVAEISAGWRGFNVEKNLRNPLEVAAFCGIIVETANQLAILTGLNCFNVEKKLQTLSNGAVFGSGGFRGQEQAVRVTEFSAGLRGCNVEEKLQTLSSGAVLAAVGLLNLIKGERKNVGTSNRVFVGCERFWR